MKTFVLIVSKRFPKTHLKSGQSTGFVENIERLFIPEGKKIHTLRSNYHHWLKRSKEINEGKAILSIRYWSHKPYRSKQVEICRLEKIGIEKIVMPQFKDAKVEGKKIDLEIFAENDGLSFEDFRNWFSVRQKEPMAIIHFTNFRYSKKIEPNK